MSAPGVNRPSEPSVPQPSTPPPDSTRPSGSPSPSDPASQGTQGTQDSKAPKDTPPPPPETTDSNDDKSLLDALTSFSNLDPETAEKVTSDINSGLDQITRAFENAIKSSGSKDEKGEVRERQQERDKFTAKRELSRDALQAQLFSDTKSSDRANALKGHFNNLLSGLKGNQNPNNQANPNQQAANPNPNKTLNDVLPKLPAEVHPQAQATGPQPKTALTPEQKAQQLQEAQAELQIFAQAFRSLPEGDPKKDLLKGMLNELAGQIKQFEKPEGKPPDSALSNKIAAMLGDKVASKTKDAKETTEEVKKGEEAKAGGQVADSSTTVGASKGKQGQSGQGDQSGQGQGQSQPDLSLSESAVILVCTAGTARLDQAGKDSLRGAQFKAAVRAMENGAVACITARAVRMTYEQNGDREGSGRGESQDKGVSFGMFDQDGKLAAAGCKVDAAAAGLGGCYGVRTADGKLVPMWAAAYGDDRGLSADAREAAKNYSSTRAFIAASTLSGSSAAKTGQIQFAHRC